ncbi:uncharacterized protein F5891DRAFT_1223724 [Suillus fuscotomentosus]|uniref:Uncharacterized protein n=1 Tax=Suillus fuscotomentosus TaxID=1912939 RepID=A0AAD4HKL9_9AGAM|nr:uncharacterized protein F5891DRAFT_1223724 [Suillus fuscotomentosus]KAG1901140.1 hypothetical protein F5891DRAFT_1223724 [Suillus fuscotomentosus]
MGPQAKLYCSIDGAHKYQAEQAEIRRRTREYQSHRLAEMGRRVNIVEAADVVEVVDVVERPKKTWWHRVLKKLGLKQKEHCARGMPRGRDMTQEGYVAGGIACRRNSKFRVSKIHVPILQQKRQVFKSRNATKTTMHSMSRLHQTAGKAKANILCFDGGGTGTGSCFGIPGEESDDEAETIQVVQSSIPGGVGGDAVDAGTGSCFGIPGDELDNEAETMLVFWDTWRDEAETMTNAETK